MGLYNRINLPEVDSTESFVGFAISPPAARYGPWKVGAILYAFLWGNAASPANVFRSIDDGLSWQQMDAANTILGDYNRPRAAFDASTGIITVAYVLGTGSTAVLRLKDFDTSTDLWSAEYAATGPACNMQDAGLVIKATGEKVFFFHGLQGTSDGRTMWTQWNGTAWSTPVLFADNVASGGGNAFRGAAIEPESQNIHVVYQHSATSFGNPTFYHRVLKSDLTLGAVTTLDTMVDARVDLSTGLPLTFFDGKVYVWMLRGTSYNAKVGSPASLPSSFTEVAIADAPTPNWAPDDSGNHQDLIGLVSADGSQLIVLFIWEIGPIGDDDSLDTVQMHRTNSTNGTTWSTPALWFDFWPTVLGQSTFSAVDLGTGGVDGIGAFGEISVSAVAYYMFKSCPCGEPPPSGELGNRFY